MDDIRDAISDLVAGAINNDLAGGDFAGDILGLFPEGMAQEEMERVFNGSVVFMLYRGFSGCLPESGFAIPSGEDIKEAILEELREIMGEIDSDCDGGSDEADLRRAIADVENEREDDLRRRGAYVGLPGGMWLSMQSETCAEIMEINNLPCPDFGSRDPDGPK